MFWGGVHIEENISGSGGEQAWLADDGEVRYRQLAADDATALQALHERLSDETIRRRFLWLSRHMNDADAHHLANVDHIDREAIAAVFGDSIIGVARYDRTSDDTAEVAIVVQDEFQRRGLGTRMANLLLGRAREAGIRNVELIRLAENDGVVRLIGRLGLRHLGQGETHMGTTTEKLRI